MSLSRSIGSLVVRIVADGLSAYKAYLDKVATATEQAAGKIDKGAKLAGAAAGAMSGNMADAATAATELHAATGVAGVGLAALAVGAAATAYAVYKGAQEQVAYQKALTMTGNFAGTTAGQMADMAARIGGVVGTTHDAAGALAAMAQTGQVAGGQLQQSAQTAVEMQRALGVSVADTAQQFAKLAGDPVKASLALNEGLHYLTASTYAQIKAAQDMGDADRAASLAQGAYADAMHERTGQIVQNLGFLETGWRGVKDAALKGWDAMLGLGREATVTEQISKIQDQLQNARNTGATDAEIGALEKQLVYYQRMAASMGSMAVHMADKVKREEASIALAQEADKYASKQVLMQREIAKAQQQLADSNGSAADYAAYQQAVVGIANKFKEVATTAHAANTGAREAAKAAAEAHRIMLANAAEQTKVVDAAIEADEKARLGVEKQIYTARTMAEQIEFETRLLGMNAEQRAVASAERELERQGIVAGTVAYDAYIQRIKSAAAAKATTEAGIKAADALETANKKAAEESSKYWEDALMRAFESGKGFFQSLWDTIKNTMKTQVLKVSIQGVMGTVGIGAAGAANAGSSLLGGASSSFLGNAASSLAGGTLFASNAAYGAAIGTTSVGVGSQAAMLAAQTGEFGAAGLSATAGAAGGAAGTLATAMPYIGAAVAAYMIADSLFGSKGGPKSESSYGSMASLGNTSATGLAGTYATGVEDAWTALAKQLDLNTKLKVGTFVSVDNQGDAMTQLATSGTVNGQEIYSRAGRGGGYENVGRTDAELKSALAEETTRILFAALKASDLPEQYKTYLNGIADNVADMTTAMLNVAVIHDFNTALLSLPFENLKNLGFDAAKALIETAGGLDALKANLGTYYTNFYSAEEQRLQTIKTIDAATAGSGLDAATATREQFRALVEAQDLTTESGQKTYAALLGVAGDFAGLTPVIEDTAAAAEDAKKAASDLAKSAYDNLSQAIDAQRSIYEVQIDAAQQAVDEITSVFDVLKTNVAELYGSVGDSSAIDGSAFIDQALSAAKSTGYLPDSTQLADAIQAARGGVDSAIYASQADADFARLELAGRLDQLKTISGDQLSGADKALKVAQDQLTALDLMAENAKAQLDALDGIGGMVLDIGTAMGAFQTAIADAGGAQSTATDVSGATAGFGGPVTMMAAGLSASDFAKVAASEGADAYIEGVKAQEILRAASMGQSARDISGMEDSLREQYAASVSLAKMRGEDIPAYAVGTNFVPEDGPAYLHRGEAVIPAAYNPASGGMGNTARLEALIVELTAKVAALEAPAQRTANAIEGNQSRPILVEIA